MPLRRLKNVKPIRFVESDLSAEDDRVLFRMKVREDAEVWISMTPQDLSEAISLMQGAAAHRARRPAGGADSSSVLAQSIKNATVVAGFMAGSLAASSVRLLSFLSPAGKRHDFAIPSDARTPDGRLLTEAIADSLVQGPSPAPFRKLN